MIPLLGATSGGLAPTASYAVRLWAWTPAGRGVAWDGELTLTLGKRERSRVFDTDTYLVCELVDEGGNGRRVFLLENVSEPDSHGPLKVVLGGGTDTCSCEMGRHDRPRLTPTGCKHRCGIRALIENGLV